MRRSHGLAHRGSHCYVTCTGAAEEVRRLGSGRNPRAKEQEGDKRSRAYLYKVASCSDWLMSWWLKAQPQRAKMRERGERGDQRSRDGTTHPATVMYTPFVVRVQFVVMVFRHLASPVSGSVDKGGVQMTAIADKQICSPGDTLSVTAKICNSSSKKMKPKFNLMQTVTYSAGSSNNHCCKSLCKVVGETIAPNSQETASCQLMVSPDAIYTLNNCEIVSVDYFIKVYLDIKFAIDPEVVLPLIIGPAKFASKGFDETAGPYAAGPIGAPSNSDFPPPSFPMGSYSVPGGPSAPPQPGQAFGAYPAGAFGAPGYSQFPPPSFPAGPYPAPTAPGTYGYPTPDPSQPKNQWLQ
ncbi:uncharacterized protein LOC141789900 isoform X2 [Halichoeres trimaculatus]|uniref:uncharacterized protein LOC141789900 isoform X2 n=1 Tax=Halichoeres trimaculatus TaxID=147232 RepID=UPI003D9F0E0F